MSHLDRRPRLPTGRRIPLNVSLDQDTITALTEIGQGNRSAAITQLVRDYLSKRRAKSHPVTP
jgi:metal-responsive CopG/Arc/MetJ family transcriptional regulator